jgi:hypothetical protein
MRKEKQKKEINTIKATIKYIKKGWGADCKDYNKDCPNCEAKKVVEFLEEHIIIIKEDI